MHFQDVKTKIQMRATSGAGSTNGAVTPASYGMHSNYLPPFKPQRDRAGDRAVLLDMLGQLGDHAQRAGTTVLVEPLNRYEDHMLNTLAQGVDLLTALGHGSVKLMADLFHMNIEEPDSAAALDAAMPHVAHVHLADSTRAEPVTCPGRHERSRVRSCESWT